LQRLGVCVGRLDRGKAGPSRPRELHFTLHQAIANITINITSNQHSLDCYRIIDTSVNLKGSKRFDHGLYSYVCLFLIIMHTLSSLKRCSKTPSPR
jgi:hypothetical protein